MKLLKPIDSVLLLSAVVFGSSCAILKFAGGVGPCGPSNSIAALALLGAPISGLGMIIGLMLSIGFARRGRTGEHVDDKHD